MSTHKKENAPVCGGGNSQNHNPGGSQNHSTPSKHETIKPFSIIRKAYLPPGFYDLECIGWKVNPPSQGLREKLAFSFKTNGTQFDNLTTARYYNIKRNEDDIQHFPPRSDYTLEIGRLWPDRDDIQPDDLVGKTVRCDVAYQTKDRRGKKLKYGIKPTQIKEILGWPE